MKRKISKRYAEDSSSPSNLLFSANNSHRNESQLSSCFTNDMPKDLSTIDAVVQPSQMTNWPDNYTAIIQRSLDKTKR